MTEYYIENFESYAELFKEHACYVAELMKILDDEIISMGLPPVGRTKELFRITLDLLYHVDRSYKKKHNLEEEEYKMTTYMSEKAVISAMRSAVREEFEILNGTNNEEK